MSSCRELGRQVEQGKEAAVVESVKAASEVYAPVSGEVVAVNDAIAGDPAKVNADPMGEGWFLKLKLADPRQLDGLMDEAAYDEIRRGAGLMRYLPLTAADRRDMLATIGVRSIDDLFADVPAAARRDGLVDLPLAHGRARGRARACRSWRRRMSPPARCRSFSAAAPIAITSRPRSII